MKMKIKSYILMFLEHIAKIIEPCCWNHIVQCSRKQVLLAGIP